MFKLSRCLSGAFCMLAVALTSLAAEPPSNASGTLKVDGTATPLRYAYALHDAAAKSTRVLITSMALSPAMLAEEAALGVRGGPSALRDRVRKGQGGAIQLFVNDAGVMDTVMVFAKDFDGPLPATSDSAYWYEPYRMTGGWTGARSRTRTRQSFFDNQWEYEVAYFAPLGRKGFEVAPAAAIETQRKEVDAREKARIVAPGGGEEGAMYLAFYRNLEATNAKGLLEQMTSSMKKAVAAQMNVPSLSATDLMVWAQSRSVPPGKVEIVGGVRDADGTLLEWRKTSGTREEFGTARIVKEGGVWKVAELTW